MYPFVMSAPQFFYPIGHPVILKKGRDQFLPLDDLFGLIRCRIRPPGDLYFPILPERDPDTGKVLFHLNVMQGTWVSLRSIMLCQEAMSTKRSLSSIIFQTNLTHFLLTITKPSLILKGKLNLRVTKDSRL